MARPTRLLTVLPLTTCLILTSAIVSTAFAQTETPTADETPKPAIESKEEGNPPPPPPPPHHPPHERGEKGEHGFWRPGPKRPFGDKERGGPRPPIPSDDPRFQENLKRWKELPPERREEFRRRDEKRRVQINKEIDNALTEGGLTLTEEQKEDFKRRYRQERRKIEENIRQQMEAIRKKEVETLTLKLVEEFKTAPSASSTPATPSTPSAPAPSSPEKPADE